MGVFIFILRNQPGELPYTVTLYQLTPYLQIKALQYLYNHVWRRMRLVWKHFFFFFALIVTERAGFTNCPDSPRIHKNDYYREITDSKIFDGPTYDLYNNNKKITTGDHLFICFIYESRHEKKCLREFPTTPDTNRPAKPPELAGVLKFRL